MTELTLEERAKLAVEQQSRARMARLSAGSAFMAAARKLHTTWEVDQGHIEEAREALESLSNAAEAEAKWRGERCQVAALLAEADGKQA